MELDFDFDDLQPDFDFDDLHIEGDTQAESQKPKPPKQTYALYQKALKRSQRRILKRASLRSELAHLPEKGETLHIIGEGTYDFFTWIPVIQDILGTPITLYASTWTMNRPNVVELFELFDIGKLSSVNMLTGLYFKQRESSVFSALITGMRKRGQRYGAFKNHTKITLITNGDIYLVIEGSANFTSNPRAEQYILTNDQTTYDFFQNWFDEMLTTYALIGYDNAAE
jgi:hypothetical protein